MIRCTESALLHEGSITHRTRKSGHARRRKVVRRSNDDHVNNFPSRKCCRVIERENLEKLRTYQQFEFDLLSRKRVVEALKKGALPGDYLAEEAQVTSKTLYTILAHGQISVDHSRPLDLDSVFFNIKK